MGLDIIIPVIDNHELTARCIEHLRNNALGNIHIILIDNNSDTPYSDDTVTIVRNGCNVGMIESLHQGMRHTKYDVALYMHNDVYIHEEGYDTRILDVFEKMPEVGLAGFFGSIGIGTDGGRIQPFSNMLGKEVGAPWHHHGSLMQGVMWSAVLDGLALIFRKEAYDEIGAPFDVLHHFYDKMIPLHYWIHDWKVVCIGIGFDHGSGMTSCRIGKYQEEAKQWLSDKNIPLVDNNPDVTVYLHSERMMFELYRQYFPACALPDGRFMVRTNIDQIKQVWGIP